MIIHNLTYSNSVLSINNMFVGLHAGFPTEIYSVRNYNPVKCLDYNFFRVQLALIIFIKRYTYHLFNFYLDDF